MQLPQFPIGSVLFPTMVLPLHVFEPRYRALAHDVMEGHGEFGVVMIERGSEVGGGDVRSDVGTIAQVVQHDRLDDGRWGLLCVGTSRFRVLEWLPDDPYPIAEIQLLDDLPATPDDDAKLERARAHFATCWALAEKLGHPVGPLPEVSDDPAIASMELSALSPISELDRHRLLVIDEPGERLDALAEALDGAREMFEFQLRSE